MRKAAGAARRAVAVARGRERQEATEGAGAAEGTEGARGGGHGRGADGRKEGRKENPIFKTTRHNGQRERERERERETSHDKSFVAQRHFQLCALHLIEERRRRAETGGRKPRRPNITSAQHFPYLPAKICASSFKGLTDYNRETVRKMEKDKVWFLTFSPGPILNFEFLPESTRVKNSWCS